MTQPQTKPQKYSKQIDEDHKNINNHDIETNQNNTNNPQQKQAKLSLKRRDSAHIHRDDGKRWFILILASFSQVGGFICMNFPAYMQLQLEQLFNIDDTQYNILFSSISLPNIILPFVIGYLTSKVIGPRIAFQICILFIFLGQFFSLLAIKFVQYELMIFGRFLLGVGATNAYVPRQQIITKWFYGKELGFALTSFLIVGKIGVIFSAYVFGRYQKYDPSYMYIPVTYTCIICLCAFFTAKLMTIMDEKYDIQEQIAQETEDLRHTSGGMESRDESVSQKNLNNNSNNNNDSILSGDKSESENGYVDSQNNEVNDEVDNHKDNIISTIKNFNCVYWLLVLIFTIDCVLFFQTQDNNQAIMKQRNNLTGQVTVYIFLVPSLLQTFLSPSFALLMDKFGKRANAIVITSILSILCFTIFLTNPLKGIFSQEMQALVPFIFLGLFQSLVSGVKWPTISLIIPQQDLSLAVGIVLSIFNLSQLIFPLVAGQLLSTPPGYIRLSYMMIGLASLTLFIAIIIYILDRDRNNSKLNNISFIARKKSIAQQSQSNKQSINNIDSNNNSLNVSINQINSKK